VVEGGDGAAAERLAHVLDVLALDVLNDHDLGEQRFIYKNPTYSVVQHNFHR
jgi:hypothetical protein